MNTANHSTNHASHSGGSNLRRLLAWLVLDLVGLAIFIAGAMWFVSRWQLFGPLPADTSSAAAMAVVGGAAMLWAAIGILREVVGRVRPSDSATIQK